MGWGGRGMEELFGRRLRQDMGRDWRRCRDGLGEEWKGLMGQDMDGTTKVVRDWTVEEWKGVMGRLLGQDIGRGDRD